MTAISALIDPRPRDIGDFEVRRVLPHAKRRAVGPFIFFDHMGPVEFESGKAIDVRPHPHIGLATVTYLFDGAVMHRDSLGIEQLIEPGAVNWMVAGKGIVHSERTAEEHRGVTMNMEGIQVWIGLPTADEDVEPSFTHAGADDLPVIERDGVTYRLIVGTAFGETAPVDVFSPIFYLHAEAPAGTRIALPDEHEERAMYVVNGTVTIDGAPCETGQMAVLENGVMPDIVAGTHSRVMLIGGAPLEGRRHLWWNLVSSDPEKIEAAKHLWKSGGFPSVPGDDEYIPLPES